MTVCILNYFLTSLNYNRSRQPTCSTSPPTRSPASFFFQVEISRCIQIAQNVATSSFYIDTSEENSIDWLRPRHNGLWIIHNTSGTVCYLHVKNSFLIEWYSISWFAYCAVIASLSEMRIAFRWNQNASIQQNAIKKETHRKEEEENDDGGSAIQLKASKRSRACDARNKRGKVADGWTENYRY